MKKTLSEQIEESRERIIKGDELVKTSKQKLSKQCVSCLGSHGFNDETKCDLCSNYMCSYCEQYCPMCN